MWNDKPKPIHIESEIELRCLIDDIKKSVLFAENFLFIPDNLFDQLLIAINVPSKEFERKHWFFSEETKLFISSHSEGYFLISTMGLVARGQQTNNNFVNAFDAQKTTLKLLVKEASCLLDDESVYDIESNSYERLCEITLALYNNLLFFFEIFMKAYLSISRAYVPKKHSLETLLLATKENMRKLEHTNTWFHAFLLPNIEGTVEHIRTIPGGFEEQYVKYDDNKGDKTIIRFSRLNLADLDCFIDLYSSFILSFYYDRSKCRYLAPDYFGKILSQAKTAAERTNVTKKYGFLLSDI